MYSDAWFCPKLKSPQYLTRTSPTLKSMSTYPESTLLFENPEFTVRALSVSEMDNSVYLLTMRHSGEQLLIDPADDAEALYAFTLDALLHDCPHLELTDAQDHRVRVIESEADFEAVRQRAIGVTSIVVTHGHWDHIRAINGLEKFTGAITSAGAEDIEAIHELEGFEVEESLMGGETFDFYGSDTVVRTISVPGHTPGSIVYVLESVWEDGSPATLLFTGDALFPGGVGKTDSRQQFGELFTNVLEKLFGAFDDDTTVLPGHGRSTTLGEERPHLEEWGERGW